MELENILSEVTQTQKDVHGMYSLTSGYYPKTQNQTKPNQTNNNKKYRIHRIQSTELKELNKLKYPSKDASVLIGREKKATTSWEGKKNMGGKVESGRVGDGF